MTQLIGGVFRSTTCLARARNRDPAAVEELVQSLRPRLTRMALHYAKTVHEDADDLLQEAWAGLLEVLPDVDLAIGTPEQYLIRVARWRLLDARRRACAHQPIQTDMENIDSLPCPVQAAALTSVEVSDFVLSLKPVQRAILTFLLAGLTWREAGRLLGCTSANVAYHVRQIRKAYEEWRG